MNKHISQNCSPEWLPPHSYKPSLLSNRVCRHLQHQELFCSHHMLCTYFLRGLSKLSFTYLSVHLLQSLLTFSHSFVLLMAALTLKFSRNTRKILNKILMLNIFDFINWFCEVLNFCHSNWMRLSARVKADRLQTCTD